MSGGNNPVSLGIELEENALHLVIIIKYFRPPHLWDIDLDENRADI